MLIGADKLASLHEKLSSAAFTFKLVSDTVDLWVPKWAGQPDRDAAFDLQHEELAQFLAALDRAIADAQVARAALAAAGSGTEALRPLDYDWRVGPKR